MNFCLKRLTKKPSIKGISSQFAFFIRDDTKQIVAGCSGSVIYGSIYTDLLWVHSDYRKKGLGKNLMDKVHDCGRKMHCKIATVATMSFQKARGFYDKLGYECGFIREGYVDGSTCVFLRKML